MKRALLLFLVATSALATPNQHRSATPQDVFDSMREVFRPQKAIGVHANYQWEISGPHGGQWFIEVNDGKFRMGRGRTSNPNVTFIVSDADWVAISNDQLSGVWAYMTGRLKVHGSQTLARKLDEMF